MNHYIIAAYIIGTCALIALVVSFYWKRISNKSKLAAGAALSLILLSLICYYVNTHEFHFRSPISFHAPLVISKRIALAAQFIQVATPDGLPLNDNEKYLCQVFGQQCKQALMIQHLENGNEQCDRFHVNTNGSVDFGFMQVNSVHLNASTTISQLIDCHQNVDIAYKIYKSSGWSAWSTAAKLSLK